jgi:hypothetical protein
MSAAPRTLTFSLNPDDWFDEAAKFLTVLAWPEWAADPNRREGMQDKVGQLAIRRRAERDTAWANTPQLIKPIYVAPDLASVAVAVIASSSPGIGRMSDEHVIWLRASASREQSRLA